MHTHPGTLVPEFIRERFDRTASQDPRPIRFSEGTADDYAGLARLHYRAAAPATIERVITATDDATGELAGVMLTSRPTLNGSWRRLAWPGRFDAGDKSQQARLINSELRTISRVVIDPRYRGIGLASRLVRGYLDAPDTPCTEAVAAMGPVCPFFERAGMAAFPIADPARNNRLRRRLGELRLGCDDLLRPIDEASELALALRVWARQSAATRRIAEGETQPIARAAACALIAPPTAYAHTAE